MVLFSNFFQFRNEARVSVKLAALISRIIDQSSDPFSDSFYYNELNWFLILLFNYRIFIKRKKRKKKEHNKAKGK